MPSTTTTRKPTAASQLAVVRSLTQQAASDLLGVRPSNLRDQYGAEYRNADGSYDGIALVQEAIRRASPESMDDKALKRAEIAARTARDRAQADRLELAIKRDMGDVICRSDVEMAMSSVLSLYTERLMGFADTLAPFIPSESRHDCVAVVRSATANLLVSLAEELQRKVIPAGPEPMEGDE
jgi:hypothetical protein